MTSSRERPRAFSVRLFLPGGDPDGVKTVEKSNWTGRGLVIPRSLFAETRSREELGSTGVYILVGPDEKSQLPRVYVGEGDPIGPRLDQHAKNKDFWTQAIGFTSKDQNLNKAHIQFLEYRLIGLAKAAKRCVLDNANTPQAPSLSEADTAEAEGFLSDILLCLPVLGYGFFDEAPAPTQSTLEFTLSARGVKGKGYEASTGFVVQAGSQAAKSETKSIGANLTEIRRLLVEQGVFADREQYYEMIQDYTFNSPSTAAGVLLGRSSNGRTEWKTTDGRTLKSIQEAEVDK
ncbi:MAG: GIY-YIG nuclease family protein [Euryarchaeota archaeon]|nr:GIY-YIG nuclease family protein [Euryarchaeota archaeon]